MYTPWLLTLTQYIYSSLGRLCDHRYLEALAHYPTIASPLSCGFTTITPLFNHNRPIKALLHFFRVLLHPREKTEGKKITLEKVERFIVLPVQNGIDSSMSLLLSASPTKVYEGKAGLQKLGLLETGQIQLVAVFSTWKVDSPGWWHTGPHQLDSLSQWIWYHAQGPFLMFSQASEWWI